MPVSEEIPDEEIEDELAAHHSSMCVRPVSREAATCDMVILRQTSTTRLVFKPTLVVNKKDDSQPVLGEFIFQKKRAADTWEDDGGTRINSIEAGTGLKLILSPYELDLTLRYVRSLYSFYQQNKIPRMVREVEMQQSTFALPGTTLQQIQTVIDNSGTSGLSSILEWAAATGDAQQIVRELQRLNADNLQRISTLAGISGLKKVLEIWESHQDTSKEGFWQKTLSENPFVLSQVFSAPVVMISEKAYVGGKGIENTGGKYPDFLLKSAATGNVLIVEIKEPTMPLLGGLYRAPNVYGPSSDITGAVIQAAKYKDSLLKTYHTLMHESAVHFGAISPVCLVIAGHSRQLNGERGRIDSFELFRSNLREVQVITYDELFMKTKGLVELLEGTTDEPEPF